MAEANRISVGLTVWLLLVFGMRCPFYALAPLTHTKRIGFPGQQATSSFQQIPNRQNAHLHGPEKQSHPLSLLRETVPYYSRHIRHSIDECLGSITRIRFLPPRQPKPSLPQAPIVCTRHLHLHL